MPFGWGESADAYDQVYDNPQFEQHKSSFGHELVAGGAAFAGFKAFEDHQRNEGKPVSHAFAKEMLAGFAAAEVDKLAETKGEDWFDRRKAKEQAQENAERMYDEHYIEGQNADQELDRDCVPEWRLKYLDYKHGKKKLRAVNRALRTVNQTPRFRRRGTTFTPSPFDNAPRYSFVNRDKTLRAPEEEPGPHDLKATGTHNTNGKANGSKSSLAREVRRSPEEQPLNGGQAFPGVKQYGSTIATPPDNGRRKAAPPSLKLPGAALDPESSRVGPSAIVNNKTKTVQLPPDNAQNAFEVGKTRSPHRPSASLPFRHRSIFSPKRINSTPGPPAVSDARPAWKRAFSLTGKASPPASPGDVPLEAYRDLDFRQAEFFHFLDMELDKVEAFYELKEQEATERLDVLREQLHIMNDRRNYEVIAAQTAKIKAKEGRKSSVYGGVNNGQISSSEDNRPNSAAEGRMSWTNPVDAALEAVQAGRYGKSTKAMNKLATPPDFAQHPDGRRDYVRRPEIPDVSYNVARKKLKVALQEYYRGLELLKSYSLLNRTAFRKINKKYDKTVNARPSMRYMTEKVNMAWFVQSDVIEGHIRAVEDLYARYFEKGNHKVAIGKLRIKVARAGDYTETSFRNGLSLAAGLVFGVQGLVYGAELLFSDDPALASDTSYLLQHVEFGMNPRSTTFLSSSMIPATTLTGGNLQRQFGSDTMYLYYPVILIGVAFMILFCPLPVLYYRSRYWLLYSCWRLFFAGLYRVEFRDFYLGDMFCSLTYTMGVSAL
ncbi:SPX-domain-containing protein [Polyplosphaeria fusca]|uniref:SPX-domain-containing protein n=1 Tax=Polyplosphaeria fusca TaxID=682080 RepID=A0A9P4QVK0_9PLEO|nr:SPX-domain-containing protein [Polyplosphaeria fusca]